MNYFVGIDIAKFKHTIAIIDQNGEVKKKHLIFLILSKDLIPF